MGVAHHDVGSPVDQFAGAVVLPVVERFDREVAARDRDADRVRPAARQVWWEVGHSGRCLGGAVHHEQPPAVLFCDGGELLHSIWRHLSARLRDVPQVRKAHGGEAGPLEQLECVGNAGERRATVPAEQFPELAVRDGMFGQYQRRACQEVAVDHRQSVTVGHRQCGCCAVTFVNSKVLDNRCRVGVQIGVREAHEFRGAGAARRRQQQSQVVVQYVRAVTVNVHTGAVDDDVGTIGSDDVGVFAPGGNG